MKFDDRTPPIDARPAPQMDDGAICQYGEVDEESGEWVGCPAEAVVLDRDGYPLCRRHQHLLDHIPY